LYVATGIDNRDREVRLGVLNVSLVQAQAHYMIGLYDILYTTFK